MSLYSLFQRGGSVNPFEETARAGRDIGGGRDISGPRTRTPLRQEVYEAPNMQNEIFRDVENKYGLGNEGIFNTVSRRVRENPVFQRSKSIYDWINENPYMPDVDIGNRQLGYDFDQPLFGGNLSYGFGADIDDEDLSAYLSWGKMI